MIAAYPLQWPAGWPRTKAGDHKHGKFSKGERVYSSFSSSSYTRKRDLSVSDSISRVLEELEKMGIDRQDIVISTNVRTRLDGLPRSGEKEPDDSGAAVYWQTRNGEQRVMAIDQYVKVADNIAAIAATLDAMRAIERHGGAQILDRAFTGFTALPAPTKRDWQVVLGLQEILLPTIDDIKSAYRRLASEKHPDKPGGSHEAMTELNQAYEQAKQEIGQ